MSSYKELLKQKADLDAKIEAARAKELETAVAQAKAIIAEYGLTASDVFPGSTRGQGRRTVAKVAPKYRDPATGAVWTGRGKAPKWIEGKERDQYLIQS